MPDPIPAAPASAPATAPAPASAPTPSPAPAAAPAPAPAAAPTAAPAPAPVDPAAAPAAPVAAPVELKLTLPEKTTLKQADVDAVLATAKNLGLNQAQADALLNERHSSALGAIAAIQEGFKAQQTAWVETIKKDPELGGTPEEITAKAEQAKIGLGRLMYPNELAEFEANGFGNFPPLLRVGLRHFQSSVRSPELVGGSPVTAPQEPEVSDKAFAQALYGDKKK